MKFKELNQINVSEFIEKKGNLNYMSWVHAVQALLERDETATWEYGEPVKFGDSYMVFCTVNAFGKSMTAQLAVMGNKNEAIKNPTSVDVNKAMQRCLAKAIALHGIGLYIYAGEDLPQEDKPLPLSAQELSEAVKAIPLKESGIELKAFMETVWSRANEIQQQALKQAYELQKTKLEKETA